MPPQATQLAIIGGGPGDYAAAFLTADLGMQVTLSEQEPNPGGVCLYGGCIPSKALLQVAKVLEEARQATTWGGTFAASTIDIGKLRAWKEEVVQKLTAGLASDLALSIHPHPTRSETLMEAAGVFFRSERARLSPAEAP